MGFQDLDVSYIIISDTNIDNISSYLYSRDYKLIEMTKFKDGTFTDCLVGITEKIKSDVMSDINHISNHFKLQFVIAKFFGDECPVRLNENGTIDDLDLIMYDTNLDLDSYIKDGVSFSFVKKKKYSYPKEKKDFKVDMIIECYSSNGWIEKIVKDVDSEFDSIYSILSKFDRVRVSN